MGLYQVPNFNIMNSSLSIEELSVVSKRKAYLLQATTLLLIASITLVLVSKIELSNFFYKKMTEENFKTYIIKNQHK